MANLEKEDAEWEENVERVRPEQRQTKTDRDTEKDRQ